MGVIRLKYHDSWKVSRRAFRWLLDRVLEMDLPAEDDFALTQAIALDGLLLDRLPKTQRKRLAEALTIAAGGLSKEVSDGSLGYDDSDGFFVDKLEQLQLMLHETANEPDT